VSQTNRQTDRQTHCTVTLGLTDYCEDMFTACAEESGQQRDTGSRISWRQAHVDTTARRTHRTSISECGIRTSLLLKTYSHLLRRWYDTTFNSTVAQSNSGICSILIQDLLVTNTNLQIKKRKKHVFHFYKNIKKTCIKTVNYSTHWSKKHCQYESNKVNNTATKHSLCPGNGVCLTLTRP